MVFKIFGRDIPLYGIFLYIGIVLSVIVAVFLCQKRKFPFWEFVGAGAYAMIGGMIGSKLLFLAVSLKQILEIKPPLESIIKGGFVFYGGLIGGFLGVVIYTKQFKMDLADFLDLFAVPLPLGHAFGRIGCFFGGCCYGMNYDGPFHKVYHFSSNINTPLEVPLFPIQIISSIGLFLLFTALLLTFIFSSKKLAPFYIYVIAYPILRFFAELFRGDVERGIYFGLSIAQWISLDILLTVFVRYLIKKSKESAV